MPEYMEFSILEVSELTEKIRGRLEADFPFVWVRGEVTNLSRPPSGHLYFSIKDDFAILQCVWFAPRNKGDYDTFDPFTGEVFDEPRLSIRKTMRNGMEIMCCGPISVYGARGQYQMLVDFVQIAGGGKLAQEFENRKNRLAALGFFNSERKRPLPCNPLRVALITSPHGAAIHDFLSIAAERGLSSTIRLFPVPVQGAGAAEKIAAAIDLACAQNWAQLIVVIRGGGSLEDLWAFNEDEVARAIFNAKEPVIAGIGHEVDFSLADLTADRRAATPTHAAQIIWPLRVEMIRRLDDLDMALGDGMRKIISRLENVLRHRTEALNILSPGRRLRDLEYGRQELVRRLRASAAAWHEKKRQKWHMLDARIRSMSAIREKIALNNEKVIWLTERLGRFIKAKIGSYDEKLANLEAALAKTGRKFLDTRVKKVDNLELILESRNPLAPLSRGYALIFGKNGLVRSVKESGRGDRLTAQVADGMIDLLVTDTRNNNRDGDGR